MTAPTPDDDQGLDPEDVADLHKEAELTTRMAAVHDALFGHADPAAVAANVSRDIERGNAWAATNSALLALHNFDLLVVMGHALLDCEAMLSTAHADAAAEDDEGLDATRRLEAMRATDAERRTVETAMADLTAWDILAVLAGEVIRRHEPPLLPLADGRVAHITIRSVDDDNTQR